MDRITRAEWGARKANPGPGRLQPSQVRGMALHWPGMGAPLHDRSGVAEALRGWQADHMDNPAKRWSDIAYQVAIDQDGNRWDLRGLATQSAANGSVQTNRAYGAVLLILGPRETPSDAMVRAVQLLHAEFLTRYPHATEVVPHSAIRPDPTDCPGDKVRALIKAGAFTAPGKDSDMALDRDTPIAKWEPGDVDKPDDTLTLGQQINQSRGYAKGAYDLALANARHLDRIEALLRKAVEA